MSTPDRSRIDWSEGVGERRFLTTRLEGGSYWAETMALARRTGGVLTTSDLRTCGFSEPAIREAVRRGIFTRWARGVYVVGPVTEPRAALKAVPSGTLGFETAAQVARFGPIAPRVAVIVPPDRRVRQPRVRVHRIELTRRDVMTRDGLRLTTPDVTIVHLARVLADLPYERAVQEAFAKRLTNARQLEQALERHRGGRGTRRLKRMLELGVDDLRSHAERSLRRWLKASGLGPVSFNAEVGPWKVDALLGRLAIEVNGYAAHSSPWAHDRDHRKEQWLRTNGYDVRRFTALQAIDEPALVIAQIARSGTS